MDHEIWHEKHVPHMNSHAKFQKLGFNSFGEIWFWIFSKMCNFGFFDIFQYEFKNRFANFSKMNLLIHMKCTNLIPKFQEGTITQKARKTFFGKKGLKILHFWTSWAIWCWYAQKTRDSVTKFGIQVLNVQALLHAKFWIPDWILTIGFFQKMLNKRSKNPKFGFFSRIGCSMTIRIMKFGMNKHVPHMNTHVKFQKPGFNTFGDIQFWNFSKFCIFWLLTFFWKNWKIYLPILWKWTC